jgi:hypothetical protein
MRNTGCYSPPESSSISYGLFCRRLGSAFKLVALLAAILIASAQKIAAIDENEPNASTARATLIELASRRFGALTIAEEALFRAIAAGEIADFRDIREAEPNNAPSGDGHNTLRAGLVNWLCTAPEAAMLIKGRFGIFIIGARIEGRFDLSWVEVPFALHFVYCNFSDPIQLNSSRLITLDLQSSIIRALQADNLAVQNYINLGGAKAEEGVWIRGSKIGGDLLCPGSQFIRSGGSALNMEAALVIHRVILTNGFKAFGEVRLQGATIDGDLLCYGGEFKSSETKALNAAWVKIGGNVLLKDGFRAEGEVSFQNAAITGYLDCGRATFISTRAGYALNANRATIGAVLLVDEIKPDGKVDFGDAAISASFVLKDVRSSERWSLDLRHTKVGRLDNADAQSWPRKGNLLLRGFTYDEIGDVDAQKEIAWLRRQPSNSYSFQPYDHLAAVLRKSEFEDDAIQVMIAKNLDHGKSATDVREWFWYNGPAKLLVGYAYYPWHAFVASLVIVAIGTAIFWVGHRHGLIMPRDYSKAYIPGRCDLTETYPRFDPFVYSLETFVPFLKLDMGQYWMPNANRDAGLNPLIRRLAYGRTASSHPRDSSVWLTWGCVLRWYVWIHILIGGVLTALWITGLIPLLKS